MKRKNTYNPEIASGLEAFRLGSNDVYLIGSFERRVTFIGQQSRTLSFVRELCAAYSVSGHSCCVIGGGIAGVTATIALLRQGVSVTLVESQDKLLSIQEEAKHRFVHPEAYDWGLTPAGRSAALTAGSESPLPWPYSWSSGTADGVVEQLRKNFMQCIRSDILVADFRPELGVKVERLVLDDPQGPAVYIEGREKEHFDFVVVAIGFGAEVSKVASDVPPEVICSYWNPVDQLQSPFADSESVLISGQGDGALTDIMCAVFGRGFSHENILEKVTKCFGFRRFFNVLVRWAKDSSEEAFRSNVASYWKQVQGSKNRWADEVLPDYRPSMTARVHKIGRSKLLSGSASFLHRIIIWILEEEGYIKSLDQFSKVTGVRRVGDKYKVTLKPTEKGDDQVQLFDRVVLRHGCDPSRHLKDSLKISEELFQKFENIAALRLLEEPQVDSDVARWARLGMSVLVLDGFPHTRFLAKDSEGPWMMETLVTADLWGRVLGGGEGESVMNRVDYSSAAEFLLYFSKLIQDMGMFARLPRQEEWLDFAGQSIPGKTYPWGDDEPSIAHANVAGFQDTIRESRYRGRGPWGHLDMIGGVWEWCNRIRSNSSPQPVLLGGSKVASIDDALIPLPVEEDFFADDIGLRVVIEKI